jgi:uncharacterized membrane protein
MFRIFFLIVMLCLVSIKSAYAYLDPGSGSFLFQILIASLLAISFAIKNFWRAIWNFIRKILRCDFKK